MQAVVIGGGYIGLEMTASLRSNGLDTTVVLPQEHFLQRMFIDEVGEFYESYYKEKGVHIRSKARAVSFEPKSPGSKQVELIYPFTCCAPPPPPPPPAGRPGVFPPCPSFCPGCLTGRDQQNIWAVDDL